MIVAGLDIGSRSAKAVIMEDGRILSSSLCDTGAESAKTAVRAIDQAMEGTGLSLEDLQYVVATGYGRVLVPFANENISEIGCHAKGANWYFPSVRTILDMGGQDCKAINCDETGRVTQFIMNDKCAGGTGRFLELMAQVSGVALEDIGELSLMSEKPVPFNTICALFAKHEAVRMIRRGIALTDIFNGLHEAISTRCFSLLRRISIREEFTITGGISKNRGMVAKLKEKVRLEPLIAPDPQIVGAVGAALFAKDRYDAKLRA